jgi:hypothetical protein
MRITGKPHLFLCKRSVRFGVHDLIRLRSVDGSFDLSLVVPVVSSGVQLGLWPILPHRAPRVSAPTPRATGDLPRVDFDGTGGFALVDIDGLVRSGYRSRKANAAFGRYSQALGMPAPAVSPTNPAARKRAAA